MRLVLKDVEVFRYIDNESEGKYYGSVLLLDRSDRTDLQVRVIEKAKGKKIWDNVGKNVDVEVSLVQKKDGSAFINFEDMSAKK